MILEIRTYRLHPGTQQEFVRVMREEAFPLLRERGIRIVAGGPSLVAEDGHEEAYLIRAFDSLEQRDVQEDGFYSSTPWHDGPREAILSRIVDFHTIVIEASEQAVEALTS
ncbi:NIPSNAP family protein [Luteipulveratus mongoliensis]|uniref:NIPSNAP family containing protein n=1 Tax=Luteipulveratus mongoliensis TaxID=571913 RepID=A0A0K1JKZ1_9MICO|nr:NIPSNAP family protein [Luteipulveratus mongoliensis]AKU17399.1 NIPSNAP family containing protein [Luteipulveratus mongoliensis]